MHWLMQLYPRAWRERYGDEFGEVLREQPLSIALVVDVLAGAIDARLDPQIAVPAVRPAKGETKMIGRLLKLRCQGYGPNVTQGDQWRGVGVILAVTVAGTLAWMAAHVAYGDNPYVDAFAVTPFLGGVLLSMPLTSLKGRSRAGQAVFIASGLVLVTAASLLVGFVAARI